MNAVGIDLGTTNSAVAIMKGRPVVIDDELGNRTVPSAVGWDPDVDEMIVGKYAKANPHVYRTVLSVKRVMGTEERFAVGPNQWSAEEVSAEILKYLKRQVEEKTGEPVQEAIITVPAHFQMAQKAATKRAGEIAGLEVQQLLAEPSAAVMAYGPQDDEKILVYDLGGGTFDVTIIDFFAGMLTTLAVFGNNNLGGDDFDNRLVRHFCELIEREQRVKIDLDGDPDAQSKLKAAAEKAKIDMSRRPAARVEIAKVTTNNGRPVGLETVVKRDQFNGMIRDLVEGTLGEVEKALKHAKLDKSGINTVLLVGGSTYMPLVQETVRNYFGKEPNKEVNPDLAVALGAAASLLADKLPADKRHVVTVGWVPEATPEEEIEIEGRTTPGSQVEIGGGGEKITATANEEGYYEAGVQLKQGMNSLKITSISPGGERSTIEPESIVHDLEAVERDAPSEPPKGVMSRGLMMSCVTCVGNRKLVDAAGKVVPPQSQLPISVPEDSFSTQHDNQDELVGDLLEGDLPIGSLNAKLGEMSLMLPPNVPAGETVRVTYHVDENALLTATLECAGRTKRVTVNMTSPAERPHIFDQLESLFTQVGDRIRPEERAGLEQSRVAIEDLAAEIDRYAERGNDADTHWRALERLQAEADRFRKAVDTMASRYGANLQGGSTSIKSQSGGFS